MKISCALAFLLLANLVLVSIAQAEAEADAEATAQGVAEGQRGRCGCSSYVWPCSLRYKPVCGFTRYGYCTFYNRCVLNQCIRKGNAVYLYNGRCWKWFGAAAEATAEATAET